jgi:fibronectin-binding autotransporter adhesin
MKTSIFRWIRLSITVFLVLFTMHVGSAQTTYYWVGGAGTANLNAANVWSTSVGGTGVAAFTPTVADIFIFDGSDISSEAGLQTGTVTANMTAATAMRQLILQNNASVTLTGSTSTRILTVGTIGTTASPADDEISIASGCTLTVGTNASLTLANNSTALEGRNTFNNAGTVIVNTGRTLTLSTPGDSGNNVVHANSGTLRVIGSLINDIVDYVTLSNTGTIEIVGNAGFTFTGTNSAVVHSGVSPVLLYSGTASKTAGAERGSGSPIVIPNGMTVKVSNTHPSGVLLGFLTIGGGTSGTLEIVNNGVVSSAGLTYASGSRLLYSGTVAKAAVGAEWPIDTATGIPNGASVEISNSGGVTLTTDRTVTGLLNLTGGKLAINGRTLILKGTVSMSAENSLTGSSASKLRIGGTGPLGTIFFNQTTDGTTNLIATYTQNRGTNGASDVTLGNKMVSGTAFTLTNGQFKINGQTLVLNGTFSGIGTSNNGCLEGSSASNLTIGGNGALGTLFFDQTTDGTTNLIATYTQSRGTSSASDVTLGNKMVSGTAFTLTNGQFKINGQTLVLNGTFSGIGTSNNGCLEGSSASNLTIGGSGALGTLFFDQTTDGTTNLIATYTQSRGTSNASDVTLGNKMVSGTAFTLTNGQFKINGQTLVLNGTFSGVGTSDNGCLEGSSTSNLTIGGTGALGTLFFDQTTPGTTNNIATYSQTRTTSGSGSVNLGNNMTVSSAFSFGADGGLFILGSADLTLGAGITSVGGTFSGNVMIVPNGTGQLKKIWGGTNTSFTFPIGDNTSTAEYSPVTMTITHSIAPTIGVRMVDAHHQYAMSADAISRYWVFSVAGSLTNYTFTNLTYLAADYSGLAEASILPFGWNGTTWAQMTGGAINTTSDILSSTSGNTPALNGLEITGRGNTPIYFWSGGNGTQAFNTLTNWSTTLGGSGTSPAAFANTDVYIIDGDNLGGGATGALTLNLNGALSIGQFIIRDNNQSVTLTGTGAQTLTVGGNNVGQSWVVGSGCSLTLSTDANLTLASVTNLLSAIDGTVTVNSGQTLTVTATSFAVCTVNGSLINSGTVTNTTASRLVIGSGGTYEHAQNGGTIPTSTRNTGSTCKITGVTTTNPTGNSGTFFNYIWDCPIQDGASGAISGNITINGDLTIGNNDKSVMEVGGSNTIAVNGSTTIGGNNGGRLNIKGTGTTIRFGNSTTGDVLTIGSGATLENTSNVAVTIYNLTNQGTFVPGTGVQTLYGSLNSTTELTIPNISVPASNTLTNLISAGSGLTVTGSLAGSGSFVQGANAKLNLGLATASFSVSGFNPSGVGNTVTYSGADQTVRSGYSLRYQNLTLTGSGNKTWSGSNNLIIDGDLSVENFSAFNLSATNDLLLYGNCTIGNGASVNFISASILYEKYFDGDIFIAENGVWNNEQGAKVSFSFFATVINTPQPRTLTNNGSFIAGPNSYNFYGERTLQGTSSMSFSNINLAGQCTHPQSIIYNNLSSPASLSIIGLGSNCISGRLIQNAGAYLNSSGSNLGIFGVLDASATGNTVNFNGGSQSGLASTYHHLIISGTGSKNPGNNDVTVNGDLTISGTAQLTNNAALTVKGNTTIGNGTTFNLGSEVYFQGNFTNQGTYSPGSYYTRFTGTATQTIQSGGSAFGNLEFNNSSNNPHSFVLSDAMSVTGTTTLTAGRINLGNFDFTLGASGTISSTPSATTMFVTDGTGMLKKVWGTSATAFTFPVGEATGTAEYSPVALTVTHTGAPTVGVRVVDAAHPSVNANSYLSRYWVFSSSGGTFTDYSFASPGFTYTEADVAGTEGDVSPSAWNGSAWTALSGAAVNTSTNSLTTSTITSPALNGLEITGRREPVTYTWSGTGGDWQTAGNWTPTRTTPAADDRLVIGSSTGTFTITNVPTQTIARLTVNSSVNVTLSPAASGNILTVSDGTAATADITVSSSGSLTVNANLVLNMNTDASVTAGLTNSGTLTVNGQLRLGGTFTYTGNAPTWGVSSVLAYNPTLGTAGGTYSLTSGTEASGTPAEIRVLVPVSTAATTINYTLGADLTAGILDLRYRTDGTVCASSCSGYANHAVNVILNGRTLTLNTDFRSYGYSSQSFRGSASSSLVLGGTGALGGTLFFDQTTPGTTNALSVFTLNRTASGSVTLGNNLLVGSTLNLTNGTLDMGANTLTMAGNSVTRTSGSLDADAGTLVFTNTLPLTLPASVFSGSVQHLTMSGSGGVTLGSDATVTGTLACTEGTLDIGANTLTISGNSVTRTSGTLDADMGSLAFINSLPLTLPASLFSGANVNNLTMSGGGGVTLGSSVTVTGTLALTSGTLDIGSHTFTQSGNTVTRTSGNVDADAGTFVLGNTQAITLPANVFAGSVNYLSINSAGVTQGSATTVTGTFEIITGHFVLDAYDLNMGTAVLSAGSPTGYVKTTGAGRMRREVGYMGAYFPVGRAYFDPVTIRNATGTDEVFSVRVDDAVYLNGQSGTQVTGKRVNVTWFIDKATPNSLAGGGVDFTFYWNEAQKLQGITEFTLNHHDGTGWKTPVSTGTPSYSGTTLSFPGYKGTFSPFAIGSGASPLPVELRSFDAACAEGQVELEWITESEINNERFTVCRSSDLQIWEEILTLPGAGNSNALLTYTAVDERPNDGINYYRLTQADYDGAFEVLKTVSAFCAEGNVQVGWIVFPNPSEGVFTVQLLNGSELREGEILELSDLSGRMLRTIPYLTLTSTSLAADVSDLPAGVYFLHPRRMGAFGHPLRIIIR